MDKKLDVEDKMLENLNQFMKDFNINEIEFGKNHKLKKTKGRKQRILKQINLIKYHQY
jgi:hypothetical protein